MASATALAQVKYSSGSLWRRWDLHVHTPDTALADQYTGWDSYVKAIKSQSEISVIGVTDYLSICNYERLLEIKTSEGLGAVDLLIPNIEFRLSPQTKKGHAINLHLLVDPSAPDHIDRINTALATLTISYKENQYSCTPTQLRKLGCAYDPGLTSDKQQLAEGVNQFKPDFSVFRTWLSRQGWLLENSLIAVSSGDDGPSGLREDGWAVTQEEFWRLAHLVFSGNSKNREFWLAEDGNTAEEARNMGAPKPCVHGSDAHSLEKLFRPDYNRFCWLKANPTFEGLRQLLYEPAERVHIGPECPEYYDASKVISRVQISGGAFPAFQPDPIQLNPGLVTIIGPKGSGKSALADLIAYAGESYPATDRTTFLYRAGVYVDKLMVTLTWANGETTSAVVGTTQQKHQIVRYLSQSFVEKLCSEDYGGTELKSEIERVIFKHLDPTDTLNASSFAQLRGLRTGDTIGERISIEAKINSLIAEDERLRQSLKTLPEKKDRIEALGEEQKSLYRQMPAAQSEAEKQAQAKVASLREQLLAIQNTIGLYKQSQLQIEQLENRLERFRTEFVAFREDFLAAVRSVGIEEFTVDLEFRISGLEAIASKKSEIAAQIQAKEGVTYVAGEPTVLSVTEEIKTAESAVANDEARRTQTQLMQRRIAAAQQEIQRLQLEVIDLEGNTATRLKALRMERLDAYESLFKSWQKEQQILAKLYEPIKGKLSAGGKEEQSLDFYIKWDVSVSDWLERGNSLLDARKAHPFGSQLELRNTVEFLLVPGWTAGDPDKIRKGMEAFLQQVKDNDVESSLRGSSSHEKMLEWIFDDSHIQLNYGLRYNGTDLEKLSPGTKGLVLLILYLAMDDDDSRPLVVDQPEENLDSESVYSLLSKYFRAAKRRRQVIVITHNPNLVINTDAEQVVIASADRNAGSFPTFSYETGALEDPFIRARVCNILEGGERAFLEREKRYALAHGK
jgi:ABC-type lipoprotein export system ATPase subunit